MQSDVELIASQVALQSVAKRGSGSKDDASDSSQPSKPAGPPKDYSLKDGQTFTVKIPGREKKEGSTGPKPSGGGLGGGGFGLPPPPPPGRKR